MNEISYPEHLHIKNAPTTKLKKKDFAYLESTNLHPSTAPNKTGKTRKLFQSKKAMELQKIRDNEENSKKYLAESLVERKKRNIFKNDDFNKEERKIMTKEEFEEENKPKKKSNIRRKKESSGFNKSSKKKNAFERIKRKKNKKRKPKLSINTDLEENEIRRCK